MDKKERQAPLFKTPLSRAAPNLNVCSVQTGLEHRLEIDHPESIELTLKIYGDKIGNMLHHKMNLANKNLSGFTNGDAFFGPPGNRSNQMCQTGACLLAHETNPVSQIKIKHPPFCGRSIHKSISFSRV